MRVVVLVLVSGCGAAVAVTNFGTRVLNSFEELDRDKFLENYHKSVASSSISCGAKHARLLSHCWVLLVRVCRRPKKRGLVTNPVSILDDPFVVGTYDTVCTATTASGPHLVAHTMTRHTPLLHL